jgi:hypothetical protein
VRRGSPGRGVLGGFAPNRRAAFGPEELIAWVQRDEFDVPTIIVKRLLAILR